MSIGFKRYIAMIKAKLFTPLLMALALLTRLPVMFLFAKDLQGAWPPQGQGLSTLWYPFVGGVLAIILYGLFLILPTSTAPEIVAVVIVTAWVLLTGALHLDGLADSIDAGFAAHKISDKSHQLNKILAVFKDPATGPMGVVALVIVLMLKVILISNLLHTLLIALVLSLSVGRALALGLIVSTPYARQKGLASVLVDNTPKAIAMLVQVLMIGLIFLLLPSITACILITLSALLFFLWRQFWLTRIGGFVGDCVGACIELSEVLVLLVLYFATL